MEYPFEDEMDYESRREKMNDESTRNRPLVDTTDCLEAVDVFRLWKNFFFMVLLVGLLVLQVVFWLVSTGVVEGEAVVEPQAETLVQEGQPVGASGKVAVPAAEDVNAAGETAVLTGDGGQAEDGGRTLRYFHASFVIRVVNFVLAPAAVLYWLTMLFLLKVSLHGRLGGINHATRAFFISMFLVVFLLPWQYVLGKAFSGYMFGAGALSESAAAEKTLLMTFGFYGRYVAYWVWVLLLLVLAQVRSMRWSGATRKRLEIL
jgi:hypothetical protein